MPPYGADWAAILRTKAKPFPQGQHCAQAPCWADLRVKPPQLRRARPPLAIPPSITAQDPQRSVAISQLLTTDDKARIIVPSWAKSGGTVIALNSELGPIDPRKDRIRNDSCEFEARCDIRQREFMPFQSPPPHRWLHISDPLCGLTIATPSASFTSLADLRTGRRFSAAWTWRSQPDRQYASCGGPAARQQLAKAIDAEFGPVPAALLKMTRSRNFYKKLQKQTIRAQALAEKYRASMLKGKDGEEVKKVVEKISSAQSYGSHGAVIDYTEAREIGLSVEYMEPSSTIWKRVWLLFCLYDYDVRHKKLGKVFEGALYSLMRRPIQS